MIKEKIEQTKESIGKFQSAQKALNQSNTYSEFYENLKIVNVVVKKCFEAYSVLANHDKDNFEYLEFGDMIEKVDTMTAALAAGDILRKNQISYFVQSVEQQENVLKQQWEKYVVEKSLSVLSTLKSIKGLFDDRTKIENMIKRLENAKYRWPVEVTFIESFEKDLEYGKSLIQEVNASQDVQRFLTLVSMEQATINDINDDILKWINERKFASKIRLSFIS